MEAFLTHIRILSYSLLFVLYKCFPMCLNGDLCNLSSLLEQMLLCIIFATFLV
jgi:hypothetical protein